MPSTIARPESPARPLLWQARRAAQILSQAEIWMVGLGLAAGMATSRALAPVLGLCAAFWLVRWLAYGRPSCRTFGDWPACLLALMAPVSLWATALPDITQPQVLRLLVGIAFYYAVANWAASWWRLRWLMAGVLVSGLVLALSAPFTVKWFGDVKLTFIPQVLYTRFALALPDSIHPNVMAGALAILLPIAVAVVLFGGWGGGSVGGRWRGTGGPARVAAALVALTMLGILVLTKSRGGMLGAACALMLLVALRWRAGWLIAPLVTAVGGVAVWQIGLGQVRSFLAANRSIQGLDGRQEIWSRAVYMLEDFPFTGIGMGTFKQVANAMYPFFLAGSDAQIEHAHNLFLQVGVDLGLPGLIAWLGLLLLVVMASWRVFRHGLALGDRWVAGLGAGLLGAQAALVVHGLLDATTWGTRPACIVWAVWGIAAAAWNQCAVSTPQDSVARSS